MKEYLAEIDGGQGGNTIIEADSLAEALGQALDWAKEGDWSFALERPRPENPLSTDYVLVTVRDMDNDQVTEGCFLPWDIRLGVLPAPQGQGN